MDYMDFLDFSKGFLSYGFPIDFPMDCLWTSLWISYGFPMDFLCSSYGFPVVRRVLLGFPMDFLWIPYGFLIDFYGCPYGFPMAVLWMSLWISNGFPMEFQWISYGFPLEIHRKSTGNT